MKNTPAGFLQGKTLWVVLCVLFLIKDVGCLLLARTLPAYVSCVAENYAVMQRFTESLQGHLTPEVPPESTSDTDE